MHSLAGEGTRVESLTRTIDSTLHPLLLGEYGEYLEALGTFESLFGEIVGLVRWAGLEGIAERDHPAY